MKAVIAGSRSFEENEENYKFLVDKISKSGYNIDTVISGTAQGPDRMGMSYAADNNLEIIAMPADWKKHGKAAGPIRNGKMADIADIAFVFWDGRSPGSKNMYKQMIKRNKPVILIKV